MHPFTLYGNEQSGHAYKAALALTLAQIPYDYVWVDIDAPCSARPAEFQKHSRWCEVPLLMIDGQSYTQSGAMLMLLAREYGALGGMRHYQEASEWIIWEANRIGMCIPQLIQAQVTPEAFSGPVIDWLHGRLDIDRERLSQALAGGGFLCGDAVSIADIAVFGYVSKAPKWGIALSDAVEAWIARMEALPYFQSAETLLASAKNK